MIVSQYAITENYARKIPTILTYSLQETHVCRGDSNCHWWEMKCERALPFKPQKGKPEGHNNGIF